MFRLPIILKSSKASLRKATYEPYKSPLEIKKIMDEYIIGQDAAKIAILPYAVYNHYKKNKQPFGDEATDRRC